MKEIWKDVNQTSGRYQISSLGNLRKKINDNYVKVNPHVDSYGYLYVTITFDNAEKQKHVAIHRLVASAFVDNPYNLPIVHHIDEDKRNNAASNLFWCTYGQNNSFSLTARKGKVINNRVIEQYSMDGRLIATFPSFRAAAQSLGIKTAKNSNQISKCCRGVQGRKTAYGFKWKFGTGDPMYKPATSTINSEHIQLFEAAYLINPSEVVDALTAIIESGANDCL